MKKIMSIAICMLLVCSMFAILNIGHVMGYATGYELTEYFVTEAVVVDGKWTTDNEWRATVTNYFGNASGSHSALFEYCLDSIDATYKPAFLVEFADSTVDAGDIIQVCMNGGVDSTTPQAGADYKIQIEGGTTVKVYQGTGTGWAVVSTTAVNAKATVVASSPHDPKSHTVAEFIIDKGTLASWGANPPPENVRVACYDASKPAQGWVTWPPTSSADNPSTWGQINTYSMSAAPEGLTIGLMLALSSVAAVVSIRYFRKPRQL